MTERMIAALHGRVALIAVDEAHCISQWGPSLPAGIRGAERLRASFPGVPIGAFTATADEATRRESCDSCSAASARSSSRASTGPTSSSPSRPRRTPRTVYASSRTTRARAASSTACRARAPRRWPRSRDATATRRRLSRRHASGARATTQQTPSWRRRRRSCAPPSPSAWASTSRTCASSSMSTCPQPRSLLPGDRPRRARRPAAEAQHALRPRRHPHAAALHRRGAMRRRAQAPRAQAARRAGRLCEAPAAAAQMLLPISAKSAHAAIAMSASIRRPLADGGEEARKILSAVHRPVQRFGPVPCRQMCAGCRHRARPPVRPHSSSVYGIGAFCTRRTNSMDVARSGRWSATGF